jgi:hypothetical protein
MNFDEWYAQSPTRLTGPRLCVKRSIGISRRLRNVPVAVGKGLGENGDTAESRKLRNAIITSRDGVEDATNER